MGHTHSTIIQSVWPLIYTIAWKEGGYGRREDTHSITLMIFYCRFITDELLTFTSSSGFSFVRIENQHYDYDIYPKEKWPSPLRIML